MPQETNLNVSPYFDDFDAINGYYRVLFKPGYPVQARELTTIQSILQNQIEQFGNHFFKEGSVVIPGGVNYVDSYKAVELQNLYLGTNVIAYLPSLIGRTLRGQNSGVRATVIGVLDFTNSDRGNNTLYVNYLNSDSQTNSYEGFADGEILLIEGALTTKSSLNREQSVIFQDGEGIASTISVDCNSPSSAVIISSGVYFLRGCFVEVPEQTILLDQYSNTPSYKVGFEIFEDIITSDKDKSLNDNAQGFSNYSAPGADRLSIKAVISKVPLGVKDVENFVQLLEVENGVLRSVSNTPQYNILQKELARRTYEESGDYYVVQPKLSVQESLNDLKGNNGLFTEDQITYDGKVPSEDLGTYKISPLKAFVRGYEIETISPTFIDFEKPRTTKKLQNRSINYVTGPTFTLNRVYGSPSLGIATSYTLSLRNSRIGSDQKTASGKEIGLARVYDFALESGSYSTAYPDINEWDISLYDIQTYTEIFLNEPISLSNSVHIKGKSSGAVGFLRFDASNSGIITAYNTKGNFIVGEKIIFNGTESISRVSTAITDYYPNDIKSLYGVVGSASTFTADVKQYPSINIGQVNITAGSGGISTVSSSSFIFSGIATVGNIVSYSNPGLSTVSYARIEAVFQNSIRISAVNKVIGVCEGDLPTTIINPSDFNILTSRFQSSTDNTLYTVLPNQNISSVDLENSNLTIRKEFIVNITSNSTGTIVAGSNETFLPFDEERYVLIRYDGQTENLSADKFVFTSGSTELTINGLGSNTTARLIATLRKVNIKEKVKNRNRVRSIIIDKSKYEGSGIGSTTFNDGLTYGNYPYGTRVQDSDICLMEPDVTKIIGIFESNDTSNPDLPAISMISLSGPTNKTGDLLIGEEIVGKESNAVAIYSEKLNDLKISLIYLNENRFKVGETVKFKESGIQAIITEVESGDQNITNSFTFENGQTNTIYDYSRIVRKTTSSEPTRRLKILFESASYLPSDTGDITIINSYNQFDYCDLPAINGVKSSDIIDIRPRVSNYSVTSGSRSPFEFLARSFTSSGNSASNILASDESILLDYSYYLPRIDKIFLTKEGYLQLSKGEPSDNPQPPLPADDAIEVATMLLPAYLCDLSSINISMMEHKRYRMVDISSLENRIKNLEYYTSLSLLESDTSNLQIRDTNGLNRFKCGFFVDDFSDTKSQLKKTIVKNSIDVKNSELRPSPYTTSIDLLLGSTSFVGIDGVYDPTADLGYVTDLIGTGIKRTGDVITLDYTEVLEIDQPYGTRVESVAPYRVAYYNGTIELTPSSDIWVDTVRLSANNINVQGNYTETFSQISIADLDKQTGFGPVIWGSWETNWTGTTKQTQTEVVQDEYGNTFQETYDITLASGTAARKGLRTSTKAEFSTVSLGDKILSTDIIPYMRSRNIEFVAKRLKPSTRVYAFFDGKDINRFIVPKLIEVSMQFGSFVVGETVKGYIEGSSQDTQESPSISFRVSSSNHKYGPYNNPSDIYVSNPYNRNEFLPSEYSTTSTTLNVDTYSLAYQSQGLYYGYVLPGMKLKGQTSGAEATVADVRLITDSIGVIIGSFYIPNPNINTNPYFTTGTKLFRLTSSNLNSQVQGSITSAEEKFYAEGKVNKAQENVLSLRNVRVENQTVIDATSVVSDGYTVVETTPINVPSIPPSPAPVSGGGRGDNDTPLSKPVDVPNPPVAPTTGVEYLLTTARGTGKTVAVELQTVTYQGKEYNYAELESKKSISTQEAKQIFAQQGVTLTAADIRFERKTRDKDIRQDKLDARIVSDEKLNNILSQSGVKSRNTDTKVIANVSRTGGTNRSVTVGQQVTTTQRSKDGFVGKNNTRSVGTSIVISGGSMGGGSNMSSGSGGFVTSNSNSSNRGGNSSGSMSGGGGGNNGGSAGGASMSGGGGGSSGGGMSGGSSGGSSGGGSSGGSSGGGMSGGSSGGGSSGGGGMGMSDINLKTNIQPINNALNRLFSINLK